jgi:hypothetical protein
MRKLVNDNHCDSNHHSSPQKLIELARIIAADCDAPPELLQELGNNPDVITRRCVASNPNTPTTTLFELGAEFPEELLNNPVFGLLVLENLNLGAKIPRKTLSILLQLPSVPQVLLYWGLESGFLDLLLAIASNPKTPKTVLEKLTNLHDTYPLNSTGNIEEAASLHINIAGEMTSGWEEAANKEIRDRYYLQGDIQKEKLLLELDIIPRFLDKNYQYKKHVSETQSSQYRNVESLQECNPILKIIIKNNDKLFRISVGLIVLMLLPAVFQKTILLILSFLLFLMLSCFTIILVSVIFGWLIGKIAGFFILGIISLLRLPRKLIVSPRRYWRQNTMTIPKLVRCIFNVANSGNKDLNVPQHTRKPYNIDSCPIYQEQLSNVNNPNTLAAELVELASSRWQRIRSSVAAHPNTLETTLAILANEKPIELRVAVAQNPKTSGETLTTLATYKEKAIKLAVAQNPNTPLPTLEHLTRRRKGYYSVREAAVKTIVQNYPDIVGKTLAEFVDSSKPTSECLFLLLNPIAPSEFIVKHFRSPDWRFRYAIAQNPNTPQHIREKLVGDGNRIVRAAATAYIAN